MGDSTFQDNPTESEWLKQISYNHELGHDYNGFLENMKIYSAKYPCLHSANMTLVYDPRTNTLDPDINLKVCMNCEDTSNSTYILKLLPYLGFDQPNGKSSFNINEKFQAMIN